MSAIPPRKIAYLTGEYPKASHTFILREISALGVLGAEVLSASIRRPDASNLIGDDEREAAARTFYVLEAAKKPARLLADHSALIRQGPMRWLRTLRLAIRTGRPGMKGHLWQLFYFLEAGVLARKLRSDGIEHIHNHFADSSANVAMLAAELADVPFSFTLHGPAELFEPHSWHLGEKVARSDFTVCISHFARSQAMLFSDPAHWTKLRIVHCGVLPELYTSGSKPRSKGLRLLFVGRLTAIKGLRVLFEALEAVRKSHPDVSLTLVGDGDLRPYAEAEASRLGNVTLLGFQSQSEVAEALSRADAFVLPSFAEGVPVVLMEAMAAALPVIATNVGGVAELIEDGVSGLIVPPGSSEDLSRAIISLAEDPSLSDRLGTAGRDKVLDEFDVRTEARRLLSLFFGRFDEVRPNPWNGDKCAE